MRVGVYLTGFLLVACRQPTVTYQCAEREPADTAKRAEWVLACIKNGNPMSDEEGEDLVDQCEKSGMRIVSEGKCLREEFFVCEPDCWAARRCSELRSESKLIASCRVAGWKP